MTPRKDIVSLSLENLTFQFEEAKLPLFENVSIELPKSRAVWVRSPGGRGKSTLLKLLSGLLAPTKGRYLLNGQDVAQMSFEDFLPYRLNIGYGFAQGGLLNNKSLGENLMLPLLYHNLCTVEEAFDRVNVMLDVFGLHDVRYLRPFGVSGSQRKITCLLRAFVHSPQVVFLDDPMNGLKQDNLNDFFNFVDESYRSRALKQVFFTSENPGLAQHLGAEELLISADWFTMRGSEAAKQETA